MKDFEELYYTCTERVREDEQNTRMIPAFILDPVDDDPVRIVIVEYDKEEPELYIYLVKWYLPDGFWSWAEEDQMEYWREGWREDFENNSIEEANLVSKRARREHLGYMNSPDRDLLEQIIEAFLLRDDSIY